jgi:uncharacterized phage protein (TIGR01671 family)
MTRTIKFRAWLPDGHWAIEGQGQMIEDYTSMAIFELFVFLDEEIVYEQFTGLTDKNGKEIYEGDICRILSGEEHQGYREYDQKGIIKYSGLSFDLVVDNVWQGIYNGPDFDIIVLGNIHENPELL